MPVESTMGHFAVWTSEDGNDRAFLDPDNMDIYVICELPEHTARRLVAKYGFPFLREGDHIYAPTEFFRVVGKDMDIADSELESLGMIEAIIKQWWEKTNNGSGAA